MRQTRPKARVPTAVYKNINRFREKILVIHVQRTGCPMDSKETTNVLVATPANPLIQLILPNATRALAGGLQRFQTCNRVLFVLRDGMAVPQKPIVWLALVENMVTKRVSRLQLIAKHAFKEGIAAKGGTTALSVPGVLHVKRANTCNCPSQMGPQKPAIVQIAALESLALQVPPHPTQHALNARPERMDKR